jgi:hypothetical protein
MRAYRLARETWDVLLLADDQGRCAAMETMQALEQEGGRGMLALLRGRIAQHGPPRHNPALCVHLADEIWEFRKGSIRLFWFLDEGKVVVGTLAYKKQTQKAPKRHIKTAKHQHAAYIAAKRAGTLVIKDIA